MKLKLTLLLITCVFTGQLFAQNFSVGFDFGAGSSYIGADIDGQEYLNFKAGVTSQVHFKYQPKDAYFGVRLNYQYVNTVFENANYWYNYGDGDITTSTTSLLLEHLNNEKKWNVGYHFGMGLTREVVQNYAYGDNRSYANNFMSMTVGGILNYSIGEVSGIRLTTTALWTDPINTFRPDNWETGREDISLLFSLGYVYSFK